MKKMFIALLTLGLLTSLIACTQTPSTLPNDSDSTPPVTNEQGQIVESQPAGNNPADTSSGSNTPTEPSTVVLTFNGTQLTTSVQDTGITVENGAFVITRGGSYELKGDLSNGQIKVAVAKTDKVELILNNFTATCNTSAPLYIASADKTTLVLAAGSVNTLTDATMYQFANPADDKPNACLYSTDDLTIKGNGTLIVNGNYNNGIGCKNDLHIKEGTITVSAPNNIIKGNDSVEIEKATLKLSGGEDAIKSDATDRTDKGYVLISEGARIEISCSDDAIQASVSITVAAGATVTGRCGGDALNCPGTVNADATAMQITPATQPAA